MNKFIAWLWISGLAWIFAVVSGMPRTDELYLLLITPFPITLLLAVPTLLVLASLGLLQRALR